MSIDTYSDLITYIGFNNGDLSDLSGSGHDITVSNISYSDGIAETSGVETNGSSDSYLNFSTTTPDWSKKNHTISFWVNVQEDLSGSTKRHFMSQWYRYALYYESDELKYSSNIVPVGGGSQTGTSIFTSISNLSSGVWNHIALVFGSGDNINTRQELWVNGENLASGDLGGQYEVDNFENTMYFGLALDNGGFDEIKFYNRVLTEDEIINLASYNELNQGININTKAKSDFQFEIEDTNLDIEFDLAYFEDNSINIHTSGVYMENDEISIYSKGYQENSGIFNIYTESYESLNLYSYGYQENSGEFNLFTHGALLSSGLFDIYSKGFESLSLFTQGTKEGSLYYGEDNENFNICVSGTNATFISDSLNLSVSGRTPVETSTSFSLFTPREVVEHTESMPIVCNSIPPEYFSDEFSIYTHSAYSSGVLEYLYGGFSFFMYGYYSRTPRPVDNGEENPQENADGSGIYDMSLFSIGV